MKLYSRITSSGTMTCEQVNDFFVFKINDKVILKTTKDKQHFTSLDIMKNNDFFCLIYPKIKKMGAIGLWGFCIPIFQNDLNLLMTN